MDDEAERVAAVVAAGDDGAGLSLGSANPVPRGTGVTAPVDGAVVLRGAGLAVRRWRGVGLTVGRGEGDRVGVALGRGVGVAEACGSPVGRIGLRDGAGVAAAATRPDVTAAA